MRNRKIKQYSNGLKLVYKRNKRKEAVYFEFRFTSGLYNDPQSKLGLAHFAEHCAGLTNNKYSRQEKNNYRMKLYYANFGTSRDYIKYYTYVSDEEFEDVFKHYINCITDMVVPQEEFDNEKKVINQEILKFRKDMQHEMMYSVSETFFKTPVSMRIRPFGILQTVEQINREDILDYAKKCFTLDNCQLTVYGNIPYYKVKKLVKKHVFPAFPQSSGTKFNKGYELLTYNDSERNLKLSESPDGGKSRIRVIHRANLNGIERLRGYASSILNNIFETAAHEFFRDKYGLCYASQIRFGCSLRLDRVSECYETDIKIDCDQEVVKTVVDKLPEFYSFLQNYVIDDDSIEKAKTTLRRYEKCSNARNYIQLGEGMADNVFEAMPYYTWWQNKKYKRSKDKIKTQYIKDLFKHTILSQPYIFVVSNTTDKLPTYQDINKNIQENLSWLTKS